ncbi:ABC transporter substrate-binding protein [Labrys sp. KB_33_2]|uniref:ABC transporter substrate-binding protein n=1 Tax=unclassified Labrys (in: a-proteobacteria) TaxID=2688601 RepID=UPI003EBED6CA
MRSKIGLFGFTALALALQAPAAWAETPPGIAVVAQSIDDVTSFDPAEAFESTTGQVANALYQRLVQADRDASASIKPALASSWEAGSDGKSLTFTLARDAKFASGNPVRPEDVIFSLSRAVKLNKAPAFILNELGWTADNVEAAISKVDDGKVKLTWQADVAPSFVLAILTANVASVLDEAVLAPQASNGDFGNGWLKSHSAGSGAFKINSYTAHEALVLDANPASPGGAPKLQGLIFRNVPDPAARRLLVEQGDVDIARGLGIDQVETLRDKSQVSIYATPSARLEYLLINTKANPTLGNPAFWKAARYLVDYEGIAKNLLRGQYRVHQAFLPAGFPGALGDTPYKLDVEKAKKILADAGIGPTRISFPVFNEPLFLTIAQSLQQSFGQAGLTLDIQPGVSSEIFAKARSGQYEVTLRYWGPDYFDPHSNAGAFAVNRDNKRNTVAKQAGWVIPELSDETAAAVKEQDPARRIALYEELQRKIQKSSPYVVILQDSDQIVLAKGVTGYFQSPYGDVFYDRVEKRPAPVRADTN